MKIVSDTSPIIGLAKIKRLDLLKTLTGEILIPHHVHRELFGKHGPEAAEIEEALETFIKVVPIDHVEPSVAAFLTELDEGERQAITLASVLGKEEGLVSQVGSLLEELREMGYWLSDEVVEMTKELAGE